MDNSLTLAKKARFARVHAARGWIPAHQATSIDLTLQSHTMDPTSGLSFLRLVVPIRLLVKDSGYAWRKIVHRKVKRVCNIADLIEVRYRVN